MAMKKDMVRKSNKVIEASYSLSLNEQRLVLSALSQIPSMQAVDDKTLYTVEAKDLLALGVNGKTVYRDMAAAARQIARREITLKDETGTVTFPWLQARKTYKGKGRIGVQFSAHIIPFLTDLKRNFTSIPLKEYAGLKSAYAVRLLEMLIQYKTRGELIITVKQLRHRLRLGDRHRQYGHFKQRVLLVAVRQINQYTTLQVKFDPIKAGRTVDSLRFTFSHAEKPNERNPADKRKRETITKAQARNMAKIGETWEQLYQRLSTEYLIK